MYNLPKMDLVTFLRPRLSQPRKIGTTAASAIGERSGFISAFLIVQKNISPYAAH
jgi:hypothetical protein